MSKKDIILVLFLMIVSPCIIKSQGRSAFSGDISKFREELSTFMGPNLNTQQSTNLNTFLTRWDSAAFSNENMVNIINISNQLSGRVMRPATHFNDYLLTLNYFIEYNRDPEFITDWLAGVSKIASNQRFTNDNIDLYFKYIFEFFSRIIGFKSIL